MEDARLSHFKLATLTASLCGIQFVWALDTAIVTPYLRQLGIAWADVGYVWMCGPLAGMVVQPIVGWLSDRCTSSYGRRRPFLVGGTVMAALALLLVVLSEGLGRGLGDTTESKSVGLALSIAGIWLLTFAINAVQDPARSLVVDLAPSSQQALGNTYCSAMASVGSILSFVVGVLPLSRWLPVFGNEYQAYFVVAALFMVLCVGLTVTTSFETPQEMGHQSQRAGGGGGGEGQWASSELGFTEVRDQDKGKARALSAPASAAAHGGDDDDRSHSDRGDRDREEVAEEESRVVALGDTRPHNYSSIRTNSPHLPNSHGAGGGVRSDSAPAAERAYSGDGEEEEADLLASPSSHSINGPIEAAHLSLLRESTRKDDLIATVFARVKALPRTVRHVAAIDFFAWAAWINYWIYMSSWVTETVFEGDPTASPDSVAGRAFALGLQTALIGYAVGAVVQLVSSLVLPRVLTVVDARLVYGGSQALLGVSLLSTLWVRTGSGVIVVIGLLGSCFAVTYSVPYMMVGSATKSGGDVGISMGLLSFAHSVPQFLVSLTFGALLRAIGGGAGAALRLGGLFALIAAVLVAVLLDMPRTSREQESDA